MQHIVMVPGLGAEQPGMGFDLYRSSSVFKDTLDRLSTLTDQLTDFDIKRLICEPESKPLQQWSTTELHLSHVLFYLSAAAHARLQANTTPALLGCSLGELVCAIHSGSLSEALGLKCAVAQAFLFDRNSPRGSFLSVVGSITDFQTLNHLFTDTWIAADNCSSNYVVCGGVNELSNCKKALDAAEIFNLKLAIPHPYHSPLIDPIETDHKLIFSEFRENELVVYSAYTGRKVVEYSANHMWGAVRESIQFRQLIESLSNKPNIEFLDCSFSGFLGNFVQAITKDSGSIVRI